MASVTVILPWRQEDIICADGHNVLSWIQHWDVRDGVFQSPYLRRPRKIVVIIYSGDAQSSTGL